jgi:DNA-binding NtrC family response regulator
MTARIRNSLKKMQAEPMEAKQVLIVDDDKLMRSFLSQALERNGFRIAAEPSAEAALGTASDLVPDLALLDVRLGGMDGIALLERLRERFPECAFIVMTAHGSIETAISAMKAGATDFLVKPFNVETLEVVVDKALGVSRLKRENRQLRARLRKQSQGPTIIGRSPTVTRLLDLVKTVARSPATALIEGESGTGKELIAQALHYWGPRAEAPLVKVNCAALPEGLMESELFGHEKGAFTGANNMLSGKFEMADGGTLLLDEISEMEMALQPKLLRSIQEKEFYRVGGTQPVRVDIRIVATTNARLAERVRDCRFREDLYYRLKVVPIRVAPLRERREDIPLLAAHFLESAASDNDKLITSIHQEAIGQLMRYDWPGNIRELENMIQRAAVICPGTLIEPEHLLFDEPLLPREPVMGLGLDLITATPDLPLRELERIWILETLERVGWNKSKAARKLGISVRTIRNKLHDYDQLGDDSPSQTPKAIAS